MAKPESIYESGALRLDTGARQLFRENALVPLAPKSFELLRTLLENHGRALSKRELLETEDVAARLRLLIAWTGEHLAETIMQVVASGSVRRLAP